MYVLIDMFLIILSILIGGNWLINTQIGYICSILIVLCSYFVHKNMVLKNVQITQIDDKLDDKLAIKQIKKQAHVSKVFFAPLRMFSYLFLVFCFFILVHYKIFNAVAFFVGIGAMIVANFAYILKYKNN